MFHGAPSGTVCKCKVIVQADTADDSQRSESTPRSVAPGVWEGRRGKVKTGHTRETFPCKVQTFKYCDVDRMLFVLLLWLIKHLFGAHSHHKESIFIPWKEVGKSLINKSVFTPNRMKRKFYSWDECLSLREVKVRVIIF